jgi:alkylation response protein AidB-like acyl-CoA dehydrogenase
MYNGDAEFNELFFDDVRVPLDGVLGELNGG